MELPTAGLSEIASPRLHRGQATLRLAGFDVVTAADGEQGLRLFEETKPSIIVVDIMMTPMNGFEVIGRIRTASKVPVIAISAQASAASDALVLGANEFLAKPFRTEDLARQIEDLLDRRPPEPAAVRGRPPSTRQPG